MEYIYISVLHITGDPIVIFYNVLEIEIYKWIVDHYSSNISYPKTKIQEEMQSVIRSKVVKGDIFVFNLLAFHFTCGTMHCPYKLTITKFVMSSNECARGDHLQKQMRNRKMSFKVLQILLQMCLPNDNYRCIVSNVINVLKYFFI